MSNWMRISLAWILWAACCPVESRAEYPAARQRFACHCRCPMCGGCCGIPARQPHWAGAPCDRYPGHGCHPGYTSYGYAGSEANDHGATMPTPASWHDAWNRPAPHPSMYDDSLVDEFWSTGPPSHRGSVPFSHETGFDIGLVPAPMPDPRFSEGLGWPTFDDVPWVTISSRHGTGSPGIDPFDRHAAQSSDRAHRSRSRLKPLRSSHRRDVTPAPTPTRASRYPSAATVWQTRRATLMR